MRYCPYCGTQFEEGTKICPNCGKSVYIQEEAEVGNDTAAPILEPDENKKGSSKKKVFIVVIALLLVAAVVAGIYFKNKQEEERIRAQYALNIEQVTYDMLDGAADAEKACNLINKVWSDAIWEKWNEETYQYTCPDGDFVDDFNDALANLFVSDEFSKWEADIKDNQEKVIALMKELKNPPEGFEDAYDAVKELYDTYTQFTSMAINPNGSLNSFLDNFSEIDDQFLRNYNAMKLYMED